MQMNRIMIATILALSLGLSAVAAPATSAEKAAPAESPKNDEMKKMDQWVQEHLTDTKARLPFSFVYDGKASEALLAEWTKKVETNKLDAARSQHILTWTDPNTGLEVRCVAVTYRDFPTVEWTLYFKNTGAIVYLARKVHVAEAGDWILHVGHDGGARVFVDGEAVGGEAGEVKPAAPSRTSAPVTLATGEHEIVVALDRAGGLGWGIFVSFEIPDNLIHSTRKITFPEPK